MVEKNVGLIAVQRNAWVYQCFIFLIYSCFWLVAKCCSSECRWSAVFLCWKLVVEKHRMGFWYIGWCSCLSRHFSSRLREPPVLTCIRKTPHPALTQKFHKGWLVLGWVVDYTFLNKKLEKSHTEDCNLCTEREIWLDNCSSNVWLKSSSAIYP